MPRFLAILSVFVLCLPALAQFEESAAVSPEGQTVSSYSLVVDHFGLAQIPYEIDDTIVQATLGSGIDLRTPIADASRAPSISASPAGLVLGYSQALAEKSGERAIFSRSRRGAVLGDPRRESGSADDAHRPTVRVTIDGRHSAVVWESRDDDGDGETRISFRSQGGVPVDLGPGESPSLEIDQFGRYHVVYLRDGALHYRTDAGSPGTFQNPRAISPNGITSPPQTGIDGGRVLYVAYSFDGDVLLADNRMGSFRSRRLDSGDDPDVTVAANGLITIAYIQSGDVFAIFGNSFFLADPIRVTETEEVESSPRIGADGSTNLFVTYLRGERLFLATNAGSPQARFSVSPDRGEAPLQVELTDESQGEVTGWHWDFGDGNTSVQQNPTHVFEETGEYTVRLQVSGPGGMSALVHEEMVIVISPQNHMWIGDVRAFPGQRTVNVPVLGTHDREAQGYQIAATFDPSIATVAHVDFLETNVGTLTAELQAFEISNDPDEPYVTAGLLFDIEPPFDRRKLPAGRAQRLANIVVDINSSARGGTSSPIRLEHGVGRPPINNLFVIDTSSVLPELPDRGTIYIEAVTFPPPRFFVRGDVDDNQRVTISDAITILNYLFVGGEMPACLDAADTNDSGSVDLTDAAYALNFLFKAGSYLPEPHPRAGLDPTPDNLPLCRFQ